MSGHLDARDNFFDPRSASSMVQFHMGHKVEEAHGKVIIGFLKRGGVSKGRGVFLGNPEDSVWEDWGSP